MCDIPPFFQSFCWPSPGLWFCDSFLVPSFGCFCIFFPHDSSSSSPRVCSGVPKFWDPCCDTEFRGSRWQLKFETDCRYIWATKAVERLPAWFWYTFAPSRRQGQVQVTFFAYTCNLEQIIIDADYKQLLNMRIVIVCRQGILTMVCPMMIQYMICQIEDNHSAVCNWRVLHPFPSLMPLTRIRRHSPTLV